MAIRSFPKLVAAMFPARTCFFSSSHRCSIGLRSGRACRGAEVNYGQVAGLCAVRPTLASVLVTIRRLTSKSLTTWSCCLSRNAFNRRFRNDVVANIFAHLLTAEYSERSLAIAGIHIEQHIKFNCRSLVLPSFD